MPRLHAAALALAMLAACAPDAKAPFKVRALVLSSNGQYAPQEVQLATLSDGVALSGDTARFIGGAIIRVDNNDPDVRAATTDAALASALLKGQGRPVAASYIAQGEVQWPADFHTWNLVTAYYNLERAREYFRIEGNVPSNELGPVTVYYFPEFYQAPRLEPFTDNALFFSPVQALLVLPFDALQKAPLSINASILAHEYAHVVFNRKVLGGRGLHPAIGVWSQVTSTPGLNVLKSLDEGLADFHAFGASCLTASGCNPRPLNGSFDDNLSATRDLSRADWCMDRNLRQQLQNANYSQFSASSQEYRVGTILASALYQAAQATGQRQVLQRAVLAAYSDTNTANPGLAQLVNASLSDQTQFTLTVAARAIVRHVTDLDLKRAVCNELMDHLQIPRDQLVGTADLCPASSSGGTTCPNINP